MNDGIQKLFKHLLGCPESGDILHDEGQQEHQSAADSDGREYPDVKHWVLIGGWKLEASSDERQVSAGQRVMVGDRAQVTGGEHR